MRPARKNEVKSYLCTDISRVIIAVSSKIEMSGRFQIAVSALLLAGSLLWGRCVSCRTVSALEPLHDCCQKGSCHRDSEPKPEGDKCPHPAMAFEQHAKADPLTPALAAAAEPFDAGSVPTPVTAFRVAPAALLMVHSPPDLFLHNCILLI